MNTQVKEHVNNHINKDFLIKRKKKKKNTAEKKNMKAKYERMIKKITLEWINKVKSNYHKMTTFTSRTRTTGPIKHQNPISPIMIYKTYKTFRSTKSSVVKDK